MQFHEVAIKASLQDEVVKAYDFFTKSGTSIEIPIIMSHFFLTNRKLYYIQITIYKYEHIVRMLYALRPHYHSVVVKVVV